MLLQLPVQVDQNVPAHDEIEPRERGIAGEIVPGEDAHVAQNLGDAIAAVGLREEALQPLRRHIGGDMGRVRSTASLFDGGLADVCRKNLDLAFGHPFSQDFHEHDRNAVRFLSRGASGHPDPDRLVASLEHDVWKRMSLERFERIGIAEESRHVDQQILAERGCLRRVLAQVAEIGIHIDQTTQGHPAKQAALDGGHLVVSEIDAAGALQEPEEIPKLLFGRRQLVAGVTMRIADQIRMIPDVADVLGDLLR